MLECVYRQMGEIMAKSDFSKAEEFFEKEIQQLKIDKIVESTESVESLDAINQYRLVNTLLTVLKYEIKRLTRLGVNPYELLKIDKSELKKFINQPGEVTLVEWEKIKKWKNEIDSLMLRYESNDSVIEDEEEIERARQIHINKRFNVNDKWLPLK